MKLALSTSALLRGGPAIRTEPPNAISTSLSFSLTLFPSISLSLYLTLSFFFLSLFNSLSHSFFPVSYSPSVPTLPMSLSLSH